MAMNGSKPVPVNAGEYSKSKAKLGHQIGEGARCLKCDCPGLDLHYWRKVCKNCSHRMDDHDVIDTEEDHGKLIIGRLFDIQPTSQDTTVGALAETSTAVNVRKKKKRSKKRTSETLAGAKGAAGEGKGEEETESEEGGEEDVEEEELIQPVTAVKKNFPISQYNVTVENSAGKDKAVEYTWVPTNDTILIEKYFAALPEEERPITGTAGALDRRQKLQYQLPYHDSNAAAARSIKTDEDMELHTKYIKTIKEKVVGVGQLIEWTEMVRKLQTSDEGGKDVGKRGVIEEPEEFGRCRTCGVPMKAGDIGVITDHGNKTEVWHPNCFRCHTCQQRLVDMLYFYKDGEYYCGRHFGDTMYPRCAGCDELIFSKEYTFAESKNWHFDHFCCFGCDKELGGHRYMVRDEQPYCFDCYMKHFAKSCHSCHSKIAPDQQRISYKNLHWHADGKCFQCRACHKVLLNQKFIIKSNEVFCSGNCKNIYFGIRVRPR